ncbi:hypothetical protein BJ508DRAFT_358705 [Ascobolus immersus RN42]|uniref:Apple domain-containing protein n=1 Tax=Ascobolus immersus RN42 TaxID=1160509 RepID=A0A3N4INP1_ASCIM|nr:hypothetical protein BJ508DRAFT_358705 [Ascobolus immersus RN42]
MRFSTLKLGFLLAATLALAKPTSSPDDDVVVNVLLAPGALVQDLPVHKGESIVPHQLEDIKRDILGKRHWNPKNELRDIFHKHPEKYRDWCLRYLDLPKPKTYKKTRTVRTTKTKVKKITEIKTKKRTFTKTETIKRRTETSTRTRLITETFDSTIATRTISTTSTLTKTTTTASAVASPVTVTATGLVASETYIPELEKRHHDVPIPKELRRFSARQLELECYRLATPMTSRITRTYTTTSTKYTTHFDRKKTTTTKSYTTTVTLGVKNPLKTTVTKTKTTTIPVRRTATTTVIATTVAWTTTTLPAPIPTVFVCPGPGMPYLGGLGIVEEEGHEWADPMQNHYSPSTCCIECYFGLPGCTGWSYFAPGEPEDTNGAGPGYCMLAAYKKEESVVGQCSAKKDIWLYDGGLNSSWGGSGPCTGAVNVRF